MRTSNKAVSFSFLILIWTVVSKFYISFGDSATGLVASGYLQLIVQVGCDLTLALLSARLAFVSDKTNRLMYLILMLGCLFEAVTDFTIAYFIFIKNDYPLTDALNLVIEVPYFIFLLTISAFLIAALKKSQQSLELTYARILVIPFLIILSFVFYFFTQIYTWEISIFSVSGILQISAVTLDLAVFLLVVFFLGIAGKSPFSFLLSGALILSTEDIVERFGILNNTYMSGDWLEIFWFLGLFVFLYGLFYIYRQKLYNSFDQWLTPLKSLQAQHTFWSFAISMSLLGVVFLSIFVFFNDAILDKNAIARYMTGIFIICSAVTIFLSNQITKRLFKPFEDIKHLVDKFMSDDLHYKPVSFEALEFIDLQRCLTRSFSVLKENIEHQKELGRMTAQTAHDIRSPLAALTSCLKNLPKIPEEDRILMRNAANRINDIANNMLLRYESKNMDASEI